MRSTGGTSQESMILTIDEATAHLAGASSGTSPRRSFSGPTSRRSRSCERSAAARTEARVVPATADAQVASGVCWNGTTLENNSRQSQGRQRRGYP